MCSETADTTISCAFADVSYEFQGGQYWAQSGFFRERPGAYSGYNRGRYFEIQGYGYRQQMDSILRVPAEGSEHNYRIEMNLYTGTWEAAYDDTVWFVWANDPFWQNTPGNSIQWTGEIYGYETDMPGTYTSPCTIKACSLKTTSSVFYQSAGIRSDSLFGSNFSEWQIQYMSPTQVNIWDVNPR